MDTSVTSTQTQQPVEQAKKEMYDEIAQLVVRLLENNEITMTESQFAAQFILKELEAAKSEAEVQSFAQQLVQKWPAFAPILNRFKRIETQNQEAEQIAALQAKLRQVSQ